MKKLVRFVALLVASLPLAAPEGWAQTPTLEFAPGAGNPDGNGPVVTDQLITLQNNPDNPGGNAFTAYSPTTTARFALSGQVYSNTSGGRGVMFGGQSGAGAAPDPFPLFPLLNFISGSSNANYTAADVAGTGITTTANSGVGLFSDVRYLGAVAAGARLQYADLTITFSQPMVNPVLHVTGLGSIGNGVGFTTELDLLTAGVTLTRLSGSAELIVNNTQILNNAGIPNTGTGNGAASGSVRVNTSSRGITQLQLRLFVRIGTLAGNPNQNQPNGSWGDGWLLSLSKLTPTVVSGTVFEDVNYGGGAGRSRTSSGAVGRAAAVVELYDNAGAFVATTTTDANGQYSFTAAPGTYTVRVVNSSVTSSRTGYASSLRAVQTFNGTTTRVGGERPSFIDAAANSGSQTLAALTNTEATTTPQSLATVNASGATTAGPDFGFNFDVVVNTNNAGQGSLRQFILNSNALSGENLLAQSGSNSAGTLPAATETSIFMIPDGAARPGLLAAANGGPASQLNASGVAVITPTAALPTISGPRTSIDATTQSFNIGNTNNRLLGIGGTVGTASTPLSTLNGPEVQLVGARSFDGLPVSGANVSIRGLSVYGFFSGINTTNTASGLLVEENIIGASATSFTDPGSTTRTRDQGINLNNSDNGSFRNNLIGFNGGMGVWLLGAFGDGANDNSVTNNEIRGNALEARPAPEGLVFEGIEFQGFSTRNTAAGNLVTENYGHGIDSFNNSIGGNTITGNTISNNGVGVATNTGEEGSGLRVFGSSSPTLIQNNIISGNNGSGVLVAGAARNVRISQNSTFNNTRLAIDLLAENDAPTFYNGFTGATSNVTVNDNNDADTGANTLLNFPIITRASLFNGRLIVEGFARPGVLIELFTPSGTANSVAANAGFGQGQTFLGSFAEGSDADSDAETGAYSGTINGLNQGADNTNRFRFSIPLTGSFAAYTSGSRLTSTATINNSTSEFSGNVTVGSGPLPVTLVSFSAKAHSTADVLLTWATAQEENNDHFAVERSLDGRNFAKVGQMTGHGTTTAAQQYRFIDQGAARLAATVYYRLRQVDTDGTSTFSAVRAVSFGQSASLELSLYPNPTAETLHVRLRGAAGSGSVTILNTVGMRVLTGSVAGSLSTSFDVRQLPAGAYLVQVKADNGQTLTHRFVKH